MTDSRLTFHVVGSGPVGQTISLALAAVNHIPKNSLDADLVILAIHSEELDATLEGYSKAGIWRLGQLVALRLERQRQFWRRAASANRCWFQ